MSNDVKPLNEKEEATLAALLERRNALQLTKYQTLVAGAETMAGALDQAASEVIDAADAKLIRSWAILHRRHVTALKHAMERLKPNAE